MRDGAAGGTRLLSLANGMRSKRASRVTPLVARNPVLVSRVRCLIEAGCDSEIDRSLRSSTHKPPSAQSRKHCMDIFDFFPPSLAARCVYLLDVT